MIELEELEQQIVLYTKGHFKKTNFIEDIKVIISHYVSVDVEHLYLDSVYYWVSKTYFAIFSKNNIEYHLSELFKINKFHTPSSYIQFMCSRIAGVRVYNGKEELIRLGEPNYEIFMS